MTEKFFPERPEVRPMVYAYSDDNPKYEGMLKVGYTEKVVEARVAEQYPTLRPGKKPYKIVFAESAVKNDGSVFKDHDLHAVLEEMGHRRLRDAKGKKIAMPFTSSNAMKIVRSTIPESIVTKAKRR